MFINWRNITVLCDAPSCLNRREMTGATQPLHMDYVGWRFPHLRVYQCPEPTCRHQRTMVPEPLKKGYGDVAPDNIFWLQVCCWGWLLFVLSLIVTLVTRSFVWLVWSAPVTMWVGVYNARTRRRGWTRFATTVGMIFTWMMFGIPLSTLIPDASTIPIWFPLDQIVEYWGFLFLTSFLITAMLFSLPNPNIEMRGTEKSHENYQKPSRTKSLHGGKRERSNTFLN
jgi:hypothetical protein